jgi:iron complex transport system substrate-binding protein
MPMRTRHCIRPAFVANCSRWSNPASEATASSVWWEGSEESALSREPGDLPCGYARHPSRQRRESKRRAAWSGSPLFHKDGKEVFLLLAPYSRLEADGGASVQRRFFAIIPLVLVLGVLLSACGSATSSAQTPACPTMKADDAYGKPITFSCTAPKKIVTLIPAESEIVAALGLDSKVAAVDNYTDYPADLASKPKISNSGGVYNIEEIVALKPDLVLSDSGITQKDFSGQEVDSKLVSLGLDVVDLPFTHTLSDVLRNISIVGALTLTQQKAQQVVSSLQGRINAVKNKIAGQSQHPSVYLEEDYSTPGSPFTVGSGAKENDLIQEAGGVNIFASDTSGGGYPQVSDEAVIKDNPQVIILADGINPQQVASRTGWSGVAAVQQHRVYAIDVNLISRPGPRIVDGFEALAKDLYPNLFS